MKLSTVKNYSEYTDNIEILKASMDIEEYEIENIINLLRKLKEQNQPPIPQKIIDKATLVYIEAIKTNKNSLVAQLIRSEAFISLLPKISEEGLERYISLCNEMPKILTSEEVISKYKENHIELCELTVKEQNDQDLLKLITTAINNGYSVAAINGLIGGYRSSINQNNLAIIKKIAQDNIFTSYERVEIPIADLINQVAKAKSELEIEILTDAIENPAWVPLVTFKNLYTSINHAVVNEYKEYSIIFNTDVIENRTPSEICEMLDYVNKYPINYTYFTDPCALKSMTWEQQKNLFDEYNLTDDKNYQKYRKIRNSRLSENRIIPNLYEHVYRAIVGEEYETTIQDYLNMCSSIQAFCEGVSLNFAWDDAEIDESQTIVVPKLN